LRKYHTSTLAHNSPHAGSQLLTPPPYLETLYLLYIWARLFTILTEIFHTVPHFLVVSVGVCFKCTTTASLHLSHVSTRQGHPRFFSVVGYMLRYPCVCRPNEFGIGNSGNI
jgi:hypothetical protein